MLGDLAGRINYITGENQEHLYATYDTAPEGFWRDLAEENRADFKKYGTKGTCIEAREFIIALPSELRRYDPDELLRYFVDAYKEEYGVECTAALHHNKSMTNYHIHMIYSERRELAEPVVKIASRDRYYDPGGKHVRTKKEATDEKGNLLPGYSKIAKGEVYERHRFESKDKLFKDRDFLHKAKEFFTGLMNEQLSDKSQMRVFLKDSSYLPAKKIGKNNPREDQIKEENRIRDEWNKQVRVARTYRVPYESLNHVKQRLIGDQIYKFRKADAGKNNSTVFRTIVAVATKVLSTMISRSSRMGGDEWYKAWVELIDNFIDFCFEMAFGIDISKVKYNDYTRLIKPKAKEERER